MLRRVSTMWRGIAVVALVVAAYATVVLMYAFDSSHQIGVREADPNTTLVYLDVNKLDGDDSSLDARVSVYPSQDLTDDEGYLRQAMTVELTPTATAGSLTFPSETRVGPLPVTLYADGDIREWPFDAYTATSVQVRVFTEDDAGRREVPAEVEVTDSLSAWVVDSVDVDPSPNQVIDIHAYRTAGGKTFGLIMCVTLAILPISTLFVSIQTLRRRKQFLPPIVGWFAVMLFAALPIRNQFPGSPPIGSWVDYTVVLWVLVGLVASLSLYILAWWRQGP